MEKFSALLTNPYVWGQFPHTVFAGFTTGGFFVLGISAYHLLRKKDEEVFKPSFQLSAVFAVISVLLVILIGHNQAQQMVRLQPMKIAAAEALVDTENPASFSLLTIVDQQTLETKFTIRIPYILSILAYNSLTGEVKGIADLQQEYTDLYGSGNYVPNIA
jgi:cytochrome d ubiquinol oxidase subunit I